MIAGKCTIQLLCVLRCLRVNSTTRSALAIPSNARRIVSWRIGAAGARAPCRAGPAAKPVRAQMFRRTTAARRARIARRRGLVIRTLVLLTAHGMARGQPGPRVASRARQEPRVRSAPKRGQRCSRIRSTAERRVRRKRLHRTVMIICAPSTALSKMLGASGARAPSRAKQASRRVQGRSQRHRMVARRVPTRVIAQYGNPKNARSNFARSIARSVRGRIGSHATLCAARASRRVHALLRYPPSTVASAVRILWTRLTAVGLLNAP